MTIQVEAPELTAAIKELILAISSLGSTSSSRTTQAPVDTPPADAPPVDTTPPDPPFDVEPTLEEVRAALTQLTRNGKQAEAKALLGTTGYTKLTEVPKEHYAALLAAAKERLL